MNTSELKLRLDDLKRQKRIAKASKGSWLVYINVLKFWQIVPTLWRNHKLNKEIRSLKKDIKSTKQQMKGAN